MNPAQLFLVQEFINAHTGFRVEEVSEELYEMIEEILKEKDAAETYFNTNREFHD